MPQAITTQRLELIPSTIELARADLNDRHEFSRRLNAHVPESWPPPLNDKNSMKYTVEYLEKNVEAVGWVAWYFITREDERVAVGIGGFKGMSTSDGTVEVGYSVLPEFQKKGYATEAVKALLDWAFGHPEVHRVIAETLPHLTPSIRVLEKIGFRSAGKGSEEGTIRFELLRPTISNAYGTDP